MAELRVCVCVWCNVEEHYGDSWGAACSFSPVSVSGIQAPPEPTSQHTNRYCPLYAPSLAAAACREGPAQGSNCRIGACPSAAPCAHAMREHETVKVLRTAVETNRLTVNMERCAQTLHQHNTICRLGPGAKRKSVTDMHSATPRRPPCACQKQLEHSASLGSHQSCRNSG